MTLHNKISNNKVLIFLMRKFIMLKKIDIRTKKRIELVDITDDIQRVILESGIKAGICTVFVTHTTAGITINENADPSVVTDLIDGLTRLAPENAAYRHREGNSDAHIKSSLIGCSITVIIENGSLALGTWQGIYFCEFDGPRNRNALIKIIGS